MSARRIVFGMVGAALFSACGAASAYAAACPMASAADELNQIWSKYWAAGGGQKSDAPEE